MLGDGVQLNVAGTLIDGACKNITKMQDTGTKQYLYTVLFGFSFIEFTHDQKERFFLF